MANIKAQIIVPDSNSFILKRNLMTPNTYRIHSHNNYELNFILNGWGTRFIGDHIQSFANGDLVLIGPGLPHCWEIKGVAGNGVPECMTIHFHEKLNEQQIFQAPELSPIAGLLNESVYGIQFFGNVTDQVKEILLEMPKSNKLRQFIHLLSIFEVLIQSSERKFLAHPGYIKEFNAHYEQRLKKVYEYILTNFTNQINLKEVAGIASMTTSAFCRFFQKNTGKSLFNFIKEVRIGYSCKLLQESDFPIMEISFQSGYNNLAHFNNQFKEIVNETPRNYRKRIKMVT
jgi:AraC-like DNA-binding protein